MPGRFQPNDVYIKFLDDGRLMQLTRPFGYLDPNGTEWQVPAGAQTDGASIPRILWPLIGGPFEGRYRKAAVIHDWYCDKRLRPWREVHRVFFDAMLTAGVDPAHARLLYTGVLFGGPKWNGQAVWNANLQTPPARATRAVKDFNDEAQWIRPTVEPPPQFGQADVERLAELAASSDLSPEALEAAAIAQRQASLE